MNIKQLRYFNVVCEYENFTKAAEALYLSQSTLSKSISSLEDEFGCEFINRRANKFELTEHGKIFYRFSSETVDSLDKKVKELKEKLNTAKPILRLGLPPSSGTIYFSQQLYSYNRDYPNIQLVIKEITSKHLVAEVDEGSLDLGVVVEPFDDGKFKKCNVFLSEAVVVISKNHPLAERDSMDLIELKDESILMVSPDYMYYDLVVKKCKEAGFTPKFSFESYQWDLLLTMVADNMGVSILPLPLVEKTYDSKVHTVKLNNPEFKWGLSLIYKKDISPNFAMEKFIKTCE